MKRSVSETAYRSAAIQGATHIGLLLITYDALAADLDQAGSACKQGNIALRCSKSVHALHILGHLESWTSYLDDGSLRSSLELFYTYLRAEVLRLQKATLAAPYAELAEMVRQTRAVWQRKEQQETLTTLGAGESQRKHLLTNTYEKLSFSA